jgi:hypothetical protein
VNFGTPRISYGGYQIGLAFYKAVLQGFGPALSATVVRDRLIGVFFGLIVFGIVEHLLWPVRAQDALRARLAKIMRLLAELARTGMSSATPNVTNNEVESWRRRTSQKVQEVQELIESSKFESGSLDLDALQKHTGDAQIIFVLLLSLARQRHDLTRLPEAARTAAIDLDTAVAAALEAMASQVTGGSDLAPSDLYDALNAFEHSIVGTDALDEQTAAQLAGRLVVYRALVAAVKRLSSEPVCARQDGHEVRVLAVQ